jgi:hypothetical protein
VYTVEVKRGSQTYRVSYRYSIWRDLYVRLRKRFPRHRFPRFPERILFGPPSSCVRVCSTGCGGLSKCLCVSMFALVSVSGCRRRCVYT